MIELADVVFTTKAVPLSTHDVVDVFYFAVRLWLATGFVAGLYVTYHYARSLYFSILPVSQNDTDSTRD